MKHGKNWMLWFHLFIFFTFVHQFTICSQWGKDRLSIILRRLLKRCVCVFLLYKKPSLNKWDQIQIRFLQIDREIDAEIQIDKEWGVLCVRSKQISLTMRRITTSNPEWGRRVRVAAAQGRVCRTSQRTTVFCTTDWHHNCSGDDTIDKFYI